MIGYKCLRLMFVLKVKINKLKMKKVKALKRKKRKDKYGKEQLKEELMILNKK